MDESSSPLFAAPQKKVPTSINASLNSESSDIRRVASSALSNAMSSTSLSINIPSTSSTLAASAASSTSVSSSTSVPSSTSKSSKKPMPSIATSSGIPPLPFTPSKIRTRPSISLNKPLISSKMKESKTLFRPPRKATLKSDDLKRNPYVPSYGSQQYNRFWYYNRLARQAGLDFELPKSYLYAVPAELFVPEIITGKGQKQSSAATIFSIWNTMMGSVLLALPWAITHAGFAAALALIFVFGLISWYSATLIIKSSGLEGSDFIDVATLYLGRPGRHIALWGSVSILVGVTVAYYILMSNAVYGFVAGMMTLVHGSVFPWWTVSLSPIVPLLLILPLGMVRKFGIIVRLNSIGVFCMLYIATFIITESAINWEPGPIPNEITSNFYFLAGVLCAAFFLHNYVVTLMRNHKNPEKMNRDMSIGFLLVALSYVAVGGTAYLAFGDDLKNHQDFFSFFAITHKYAMSARLALIIQMTSVLPLVIFIARSQLLTFFTGNEYPNWWSPALFAITVVSLDTFFAIFYPAVGDVIRIVGASCGFIYIYFLPICVHLVKKKSEGKLSFLSVVFHGFLMLIGICVMILQFIPT